MNHAAVMPKPQAFAFGLIKADADAEAIDASIQVEGEKKGSNTALSSDCCSSNNYGKPG